MIPFGEWLPDQASIGNQGANEAKNVIPRTPRSYGPCYAIQEIGNALTAYCQGAGSFRGIGGTLFVTAGDANKLYSFSANTWSDISRLAGGAYAVSTDDQWSFAPFGDNIVAVNGTDVPQVFQIGSSSNYAALSGSPPVARFAITVKDFLVLGRITSAQNKVRWSAINDITSWTIGTNQADDQDLPAGGKVMGGIGGEFGTWFCENSIYRQQYVGGSLIFTFDRISEDRGCCAENSLAAFEQTSFGLDWDGFFALQGGREFTPIGDQKVDRWFWNRVNQSYLNRVHGSVDPINRLYVVAFPSTASTTGTPDTIMWYNWSIGRWSYSEQAVDVLFQALTNTSYHTDNVDTLLGNTDATSVPADSSLFIGEGNAKFGAFSTGKKLATFEGAALEGIIGTTEAPLVEDRRSLVSEIWPIGDGGTLSVSVGYRNLPNEGITWTDYVSQNATGFCPFGIDARFLQARVKIAAGGTWTHQQGIRPKTHRTGMY
ncbi:MAG: hypothetical protein A4E20_04780 [Nitrospira sp. SG-bin2]|uniref:hypothetical protein n=1 Tax=Nitrospira cf. moscoviensis SBR1015 TaxID=96242 RepID=UPI000A0C010E|nr:hypothetical protein [Nitrospira cf. moscoviensis SBR1015]OQW38092.1 MAG: hypothetical protein A4E20_04780 [Nitrospira sp. SG-bin2]